MHTTYFFKLGVMKPQMAKSLQSGITESLLAAALSPLILLGLIIYVISVAIWIWALSKVDLFVAYSFVGVSFLVTMTFCVILLEDTVTPCRILGTILIAFECVLVGKTA